MPSIKPFQVYRRFYQALAGRQRNTFHRIVGIGLIIILLDLVGIAVVFAAVFQLLDPMSSSLQHYLPKFISSNSTDFTTVIFIGLLVALFLLKNLLAYLLGVQQLKLAYRLSADFSDQQIHEFFQIDFLKLREKPVGHVIHELYAIPNSLADQLVLPMVMVVGELFLLLTTLLVVVIWQPVLFLFLSVTLFPVAMILFLMNRNKLDAYGRELNRIIPGLYLLFSDMGHGLTTLRLRGVEDRLKEAIDSLRKPFYHLKIQGRRISSIAPPRIMESAAVVSILLVVLFAYWNRSFDQLPVLLAAFGALAFRLMPSVNRLIGSNNTVQSFTFLLDYLPLNVPVDADRTSKPMAFNEHFELQDISFGYGEEMMLKDLNLSVKKGEMIGIMGVSGSGKTTLLNVIMGFLQPSKGKVRCDGEPVHQNLSGWQRNITYVEQEAFLMNGSMLDNITLFEPNPNRERVMEILENLELGSWMCDLSDGLDTELGENGSRVSGGQRQRLAIARALYHQSNLLILDEPTNALDEATKREVMQSIDEVRRSGVTVILVTHEQGSVMMCDRVYELTAGKLIERSI
ncbi:MAG: ABC transporter ATP-binding protein [Flavobacteriales bacterium]|nr:ABC transporter ATP-binding protein [Flavobacteriales bacterium]